MRVIAMTTLVLALAGGIALAQAPSGAAPSGPGTAPGNPAANPAQAPAPRATSPGGLTQPGATNPSASGNTGTATPGGANSSAQSRDNKTGKNALNEEYTDCMRLWDAGTHMSKQEWSATCRRVQSRLNQVQSK